MLKNSYKPLVVFSAVNLIEGGPLSILKDAINAFIEFNLKTYDLTVFVNNINLFTEFADKGILFIEKKSIKNSYSKRLWFEYVQCYSLSRKMKPFLWFALHDITPNVRSIKKAVYCHNPTPFYKAGLKDAYLEPIFFLSTFFYKFFYRINIKSNNYIIIQQNWLREFFIREFEVNNVIVAHPNVLVPELKDDSLQGDKSKFTFFYPAFPRVFKNFETLLEASRILYITRSDFEVVITINGNENKYAREIYKKFGNLYNIRFIGIQTRENVLKLYNTSDCLIFPSKLETWGLPISEMKFFGKPILIADELYAKETVGGYDKVQFFKTMDAIELAGYMSALIDGTLKFEKSEYLKIEEPFTESWKELFDILLS